MSIKMIALDLDDTTLGKDGLLPEQNALALNEALNRGVVVVIATGRTFASIPDTLKKIKNLKYIITSNGAKIIDYRTGEVIYSNLISERGVENVLDVLKEVIYKHSIKGAPLNKEITVETFVEGIPYINSDIYENMKKFGSTYRTVDYILRTRHKVDDTLQFMEENKDKIENISVNFEDHKEKQLVGDELKKIEDITVTTSFPHNWELGGKSTSKASAIAHLAKELGIDPKEELLACGDSPNDIAMIKLAKVGVAVGNATSEVKEAADFIAKPYYECGVCQAIEKFVFSS